MQSKIKGVKFNYTFENGAYVSVGCSTATLHHQHIKVNAASTKMAREAP